MDPTPIVDLTVPAVMEHLGVWSSRRVEPAPILMGHSAGGVFTQLLMDRGGTAPPASSTPAPTEGVKRLAAFADPGRASPCSRTPPTGTRPSGSTFEQWRYVFTNTFQRGRRRTQAVRALPHPRVRPGCSGECARDTSIRGPPTRTSTTRTPTGRRCSSSLAARITSCRPVDPALPTPKHYKARGHDHRGRPEYEGRAHLMPSQTGWEEVADHALSWATEQAAVWAARHPLPATA